MDRNSEYIVRIIYCSVNLRDVILIKVTVKKRYVNSPWMREIPSKRF